MQLTQSYLGPRRTSRGVATSLLARQLRRCFRCQAALTDALLLSPGCERLAHRPSDDRDGRKAL